MHEDSFYALIGSKLEYACVLWNPYQQIYINLIENVLRKFAKICYFKMFGCYPNRHCYQRSLLNLVDESSLTARRHVNGLIFLQKCKWSHF